VSIFQLALYFFVVTNPIGNSPTIVALVKDYTLREQQKILFREAMFALALAIFFLFLGNTFLTSLSIDQYALEISGGVLLFLVALKMIFSSPADHHVQAPKTAPFIVPIATPLLSGAGLFATIMIYASQEQNNLKVLSGILLAWAGITPILVFAPYLQLLLGKRGLLALEQLMGMILVMIAIDLIVGGSAHFLTVLIAARAQI
jgi:multiple antibiotic resistance protein